MAEKVTSPELASLAARVAAMSDAEVIGFACKDPGAVRRLAASLVSQAGRKTRAQPK